MVRYSERPLRWVDVMGRFEARASAEHASNALAYVQRLYVEGETLWNTGSPELARWQRGCSVLQKLLSTWSIRRHNNDELATVFREFIHEFEHSTTRLYQFAAWC